MEPISKPIYMSKTFWVQIVMLIALVVGTKVPSLAEFLKAHFSEIGGGWAILNVFLRLISKDKIEIA